MSGMKTVVWKSLKGEGLEHCTLHEHEDVVNTSAAIIRIEDQSTFRLDYSLTLTRDYTFVYLNIQLLAKPNFSLMRDGYGNWTDTLNMPLPELAGCIDVDITATPFTNTLPIRRVDWQVGQSETFKMAWISVPEMTVTPNRQRYTCLEKSAEGAKFHFESLDIHFEAVITVDADGLVLDYPGLFKRVV